MKTIPASDFIHLGDLVRFFHASEGCKIETATQGIQLLEGIVNRQPFEHVGRYMMELKQVREWLESSTSRPGGPTEVSADANRMIAQAADHLRSTIYSESQKWQTIILNQSAVSAKLRSLEARLKFDDQKALLADTIRCLECGAPRAAIVMGWNLTYEYLRRFVFDDKDGRLKTFNKLLEKRKRNKTDNYEPISEYEQLQDLGERFVIDLLFEAALLSKRSHQTLIHALNRRNHFAHPNMAKASDESAAGFIDDLIANVFDNPHFVLSTPEPLQPPNPPIPPSVTP